MQERKPRFTSLSGFDTNRVYTHHDLKDWSPAEELGAPGEFPYTRGVYPTMYRGNSPGLDRLRTPTADSNISSNMGRTD
jgi:methylmalonyl-CoA mutase N-terminal domain/subunit